jgi:hypothetical protein
VSELRAKFIGGPRAKKTRSLKGTPPAVITCEDDCRFHNVKGFYKHRGVNGPGVTYYDWVGDSPRVVADPLPTIESLFGNRPE